MGRRVELQCGSTTLSLNDSTYLLQAAGGWLDEGQAVRVMMVVKATTMTAIERAVAPIVQMIRRAELYSQDGAGDPVYVRTKTCDSLSLTAEVGATWKRKRVLSGTVSVEPIAGVSAAPSARVAVELATTELWQRAAPVPVVEASAATAITARTDGGLTVAAAGTLTARRVGWTAGEGFTVRVRWLYSDNNCDFFNAEAGTYDVKAYYLASDNKLYMQDSAGTTASSSALTATAGDELDLVFKWDPATPKMGIWMNGSANGTAATCVLEFALGAELLTNGGFETVTGTDDDGTSDTFNSWSDNHNDGAGNKVEATATVQAGSHAMKLTYGNAITYAYQSFSVTPGGSYKATLYTRGDGSKAGRWAIYANLSGSSLIQTSGVAGTSYTAQTVYVQAPADTTTLYIICYSPLSAGTCYYDTVSVKRNSEPDTYLMFAPSTAAQSLLSWQLWPDALTDAECAALYANGRPEPELAWTVAPANDYATNAGYTIYNTPGQVDAPLRLALASTGGQDFGQVLAGFLPWRAPTMVYECESGTLGTDTANNANADASAGNQARVTPAASTWVTRVTVTLASNPLDMAALAGRYRLYLAGYDSAASVQVNSVKWRLVVGGVAGDYSDVLSFGAVATRSLLDCGELTIPPGNWPEDTLAAVTTSYGSAFCTLEIQSANTTGSGGGTLDLDAIYLAPAQLEGQALITFDVSDIGVLLDWTGDAPAALGVQEMRSLEFGQWGTWEGDDLAAPAAMGLTAGKLWLYWLRNSAEQSYPNDTCDVAILVSPRWRTS